MEKTAEKKQRVRSPAYPTFGLPDAIAKAKIIYEKEAHGRHAVPITAIAKDWEYASVNGSVLTSVSALKQFGLVEEIPDKDPRELKLTAAALNIIVRGEGDPERISAIKSCAMLPKLYGRLWSKYGWPLPSDDAIRPYLELQEHYSGKFIPGIIKDYKATIMFAKLDSSDKIGPDGNDGHDKDKEIEVGDFVQWESAGVAQFPVPLPVTGFSPDFDYVFVDGQKCGLRIEEVRKVDAPAERKQPMSAAPTQQPPVAQSPPQNPNYRPPAAPQKEFPIYLSDDKKGSLNAPPVMTKGDFELYKKQIENHLLVIAATCVSGEKPTN
jgi:hypothetical protein